MEEHGSDDKGENKGYGTMTKVDPRKLEQRLVDALTTEYTERLRSAILEFGEKMSGLPGGLYGGLRELVEEDLQAYRKLILQR